MGCKEGQGQVADYRQAQIQAGQGPPAFMCVCVSAYVSVMHGHTFGLIVVQISVTHLWNVRKAKVRLPVPGGTIPGGSVSDCIYWPKGIFVRGHSFVLSSHKSV